MKTNKTFAQAASPGTRAIRLFAASITLLAAQLAHADYDFWAGVPGVSGTTNWTDPANWTGAVQTYYNEVEFRGVGANANTDFSVNNELDGTSGVAQMPIWELDYIATNGNYTTLIDPGVTLNLGAGRGFFVIGADQLNTANPAPANAFETITLTGPGALTMAGNLYVNQGSVAPSDTHNVTLDLSGLANFTDTGSEIFVASSGAARTHGTLYLAQTNNVSVGDDIQLCNQSFSNSMPCAIYLGWANSILTGSGNLIVGGTGTSSAGAMLAFNPAVVGTGIAPTATLAGNGGSGRIANFWVCNENGGPQIAGNALADFTGGSVSIKAGTLQLGQGGNTGANATGTLTLDNGLVDVNSATIGNQEVSAGGAGVGVVNLNGNAAFSTNATMIVHGALTLGAVSGSATAGTAGTININGGELSAGTIVSGGGASALNLTNGTLTVAGAAGTASAPLSNVSIVNSILNLALANGATNIVAANLAVGGATNIINITSTQPSPSYPARFVLVKYAAGNGGTGFNFGLGSLPLLCAGYVSNNTANGSIDLVLTQGPFSDTWTGAVNGNWDTTTLNWLAGGATAYTDGAFVRFLDGADTGAVNLTAALAPGGVTVSNGALSYIFSGSGSIGGGTALDKEGLGLLALDNTGSNDFTGGVAISGGVLQIGNGDTSGNLPVGNVVDNGTLAFDRLDDITVNNAISGSGGVAVEGSGSTVQLAGANSFTGSVLVTNGSTLQLGGGLALGGNGGALVIANGSTLDAHGYNTTKPIIVSGTGVNGNGAIIDTGGAIYDNPGPGLATSITLAGDASFNMQTRWDLGSAAGGSVLSTGGQPYNLTLNGSGYFEWYNLSLDSALANIIIASGNLGAVGSTSFGNPSATLTLSSGAALTFYGPNVSMNKQVDFQASATINNGSGANSMTGAMTMEPGNCQFNIGTGTTLTLSNVMSGSGIFYQFGGGGTSILWGDSPAFTGGIVLYDGQITLDGTVGCGITNSPGTTLAGDGTAEGVVDMYGTLQPGGAGAAGTFTAGGLILEDSAIVTMDLAPTVGVGGANDLIAVNGDLTVSDNNITINPLNGTLASGTYTLFTYTGALNGSFGAVSTASSSRYSFTIATNVPHVVQLIVTGKGDLLVWNNGSGDGQWNVQSSFNWSNLTTHTEDQFFTADTVVFDDSINQAANPSTSVVIGSGQVVIPSIVTNNSTTNYSISGSGKISGGASMVKLGASTLNISTENDFSGNFTIGAGAVQLNGQLLASGQTPAGNLAGTLYVSNGTSLIVNLQGGYPNGDSGFSTKPLVISGTGANGQGAVQIIGNPLYNDSSTLGLGHNVTLAGNTTISGTTRWDWGYPGYNSTLSTGGSNYSLTAIEPGYSQWAALAIDPHLGNFDFISTASSQQTWAVSGMGASLGNPTNVLTLHSNVLINIQHGSSGGDSGYAKIIHVMTSAGVQYQPSGGAGDYRLGASFIVESNGLLAFYSGNGGNGSGTVINGTVTLNGLAHFEIGDSTVTFSNVISGPGGFYWDNYNNTIVFAASNTYQGLTQIDSGRDLALAGNGSISGSTNIILAGSATLDASQRTDHTLTLASGQTLQGSGTVNGNLTESGGAVVLPGSAGAIGTLTVNGDVNLSGTTEMQVNKTAQTASQISGATSITYGGTLNITNLAGTLAVGDSFKLFTAASYGGSFTMIVPTTPGPGLAWNTAGLDNGTLSVMAGSVAPTIGSVARSGADIIISGRNNTGVGGGSFDLLSSTNLSTPLTNWTVSATGTFDASGNFSVTNAIGAGPSQFFILREP